MISNGAMRGRVIYTSMEFDEPQHHESVPSFEAWLNKRFGYQGWRFETSSSGMPDAYVVFACGGLAGVFTVHNTEDEMNVILKNDLLNTKVELRIATDGILTPQQVRRARCMLADEDGRICGGTLGEHGPQDVEILLLSDGRHQIKRRTLPLPSGRQKPLDGLER